MENSYQPRESAIQVCRIYIVPLLQGFPEEHLGLNPVGVARALFRLEQRTRTEYTIDDLVQEGILRDKFQDSDFLPDIPVRILPPSRSFAHPKSSVN